MVNIYNRERILREGREQYDTAFIDVDDDGTLLSITQIVGQYIQNNSVYEPLATGIADKVALLSFVPQSREINTYQIQLMRRIGGVAMTASRSTAGRLFLDGVPTGNLEQRIVQQAPSTAAQHTPRLISVREGHPEFETLLSAKVIDTIQAAEIWTDSQAG